MAAKGFIRNTISGVLALAFAASALSSTAHADPREDRRGGGGARPAAPSVPRGGGDAPRQQQPRDWSGDRAPTWHTPPATPTDRGPAPSSGWNGRNPTYADPQRNPTYTAPRQQQQPQQTDPRQRPQGDMNHSETWNRDRSGNWYRDNGWQWRQDRGGQWYRDRNDNWSRNNQNQWYRDNRPDGQRGNNPTRDRNSWSNNRNGWGGDYNRWNNDWRRDHRYDWNGWRNQHRDVFRGGYYYAPYGGYSYNRLSIGVFLGSPWYSDRYWITDPWAYRLPDVYGPYRWVRYYDDVLLIDTYTGEVVDVIYDFFW